MTESDLDYWMRRAEEARAKAEHAADPASYRMHTDFAREYERRVQTLIARHPSAKTAKPKVAF